MKRRPRLKKLKWQKLEKKVREKLGPLQRKALVADMVRRSKSSRVEVLRDYDVLVGEFGPM